ncbi:MAG: TonB family protein [Chloroherpetonaceae bacterium]|nr:TonB family protein [Chloroherpetonaceae bacterium]
MTLSKVIFAFVFLLAASSTAASQGRLFGRVVDESGKPVPAATVFVNSATTNRAALTNAQGYYVFLGVSEGKYNIKVFKSGYPKLNREGVVVAANSTSRHDFKFGENAGAVQVASVARERKKESTAKPAASVAKTEQPVEKIVVKNEVGETEELDESEAEEIKKAEESAKEEEAALNVAAEKEVTIEGGIAAIQKAIRYPETAVNLKIEGKVVVRVFVGRDGSPLRMEIMKSAHELLDEEALRVISENAKFTPAVVNGQNAIGVITIPITFKIGKVVW